MLVISWLELALLFLMGKFMKSKSFVFFPSRFQNILIFYVVLLVVMVFFCMISFKKLLIGLVYWKFFCICLIIFCSDSWWQLISTCLTERYLTPTAYWGGGGSSVIFFFSNVSMSDVHVLFWIWIKPLSSYFSEIKSYLIVGWISWVLSFKSHITCHSFLFLKFKISMLVVIRISYFVNFITWYTNMTDFCDLTISV